MRYYIAINGASCAISRFPCPRRPEPIPRAQALIGFPTLEEAEEAQSLCLTSPIPHVEEAVARWAKDERLDY
ncbi:MAG: hypothetical protein ABL994_23650, partial [Verrucomicrobiales bacterium]